MSNDQRVGEEVVIQVPEKAALEAETSSLKDKLLFAGAMAIFLPVFSAFGCHLMTLEHNSSFYHRRAYATTELAKTSPENKLIADGYTACLKSRDFYSIGATCALEAVGLARSQGRSEIEVADVLAKIGIFETGCDPELMRYRDVVATTEELSALRSIWCSQPQSKAQE